MMARLAISAVLVAAPAMGQIYTTPTASGADDVHYVTSNGLADHVDRVLSDAAASARRHARFSADQRAFADCLMTTDAPGTAAYLRASGSEHQEWRAWQNLLPSASACRSGRLVGTMLRSADLRHAVISDAVLRRQNPEEARP